MRTSRLAELALTLSLVPVEAIVGAALASAARSCHGQAATIVGTKGDDDAVTGGRSNETLIGGEGDDDLNGGPGDDLLDGGEGNDQIEGGRGAQNAVTYAHAPGGVEVNLPAGTATGWGTDTLAAIQVVIGSGFDDTIIGSGQRNTFIPGEGNDSVSGGGGPDTIDFSRALIGMAVDLEAGTATGQGTDTIAEVTGVIGSEFADTLTGNDRRNTLIGGGGDDSLFGNEGEDTLDGGDGADTLDGGPGTDTCLNGETVVGCEA